MGERVRVLVKGSIKKNWPRMTDRTRCGKIVLLDVLERHWALSMNARITRTDSFTLYGDPAVVNLWKSRSRHTQSGVCLISLKAIGRGRTGWPGQEAACRRKQPSVRSLRARCW